MALQFTATVRAMAFSGADSATKLPYVLLNIGQASGAVFGTDPPVTATEWRVTLAASQEFTVGQSVTVTVQ